MNGVRDGSVIYTSSLAVPTSGTAAASQAEAFRRSVNVEADDDRTVWAGSSQAKSGRRGSIGSVGVD
jgi:hypothetical protein